MKTVLLLLLVNYLCRSTVVTLICYSCKDAASNAICNLKGFETCSGTQDRCMVSQVNAQIFGIQSSTLNKGCIESWKCTGTFNAIFVSGGTACCETDFCNVNGSVIFSESKLVLIASASFLYIIYKLTN